MALLRQQIVRRLRLLLTVWLLALAWAPSVGAADITLHARVVQIATTCPAASAEVAAPRLAARAFAPRAAEPRHVAIGAAPHTPSAALRAVHGPSFDGRALYLDLHSLLC